MITQCELTWKIIDCVEEFSINFLTNVIQEENFNLLIEEINKIYTPWFPKPVKQIHIDDLFQRSKDHLAEIQRLDLNEIRDRIREIEGSKVDLTNYLDHLQTIYNDFESNVLEDEDDLKSSESQENDDVNEILEESRELLSRFEVILENIKVKLNL